MKVLKFGGSSVMNGERIEHVSNIVTKEAQISTPVVVLSAMKGITDLLIRAAREAESSDRAYLEAINKISRRQIEAVESLFSEEARAGVIGKLDDMLRELRDILHGIELVRECSRRTLDLVMSFGECLNCTLFVEYLTTRERPPRWWMPAN